MSVQTLSTDKLRDNSATLGATRRDAPQAWRIFAVVAVCFGVAALAAATFVLSYSAIRVVALEAGITPRLARGYPLLLDAMLVIVLAAILALRGAGLASRLLAWVTLLLVMAVAAGADALHTAGRSMPHQAAAIAAAVLPFVLVLVAFVLLLVMLRHAKVRRLAAAADRSSAHVSGWTLAHPGPAHPLDSATGSHAIVKAGIGEGAQRASAAAAPRANGVSVPPHEGAPSEVATDAGPIADDPSTDEGVSEPATGTTPYPADALATGWYDGEAAASEGANEEPDDDDGPVFHRLFSAPTPYDVDLTDAELTDAELIDVEATDTTEAETSQVEAAEADPIQAETTEA